MNDTDIHPYFPRHAVLWRLVQPSLVGADLAHDAAHLQRVYWWALRLAPELGADVELAGAAALVHDLVLVPKESAARPLASARSALAARPLLAEAGYDGIAIENVVAAVSTASWSRGLAPTSALGAVLQDADRLDAIGALGLCRTLTTAGGMSARGRALLLYHPGDPLAEGREPDERSFALDHVFVKLKRLAAGMHTATARVEAARRHQVMTRFLEELVRELESSRLDS